ncbi:MAG: endolytic transglycosylase MltG [Chitinophagaceae bacterium]|nr:endolytic transglycosylase MltG [Chitinophagaceae bacterium]
MRKRKRTGILILLFFVIIIVFFAWKLFGPVVTPPSEKYFYIYTGEDYKKVKDSLLAKKIIRSEMLFDQVSKYAHYTNAVKPGRYKIEEGMSLVNLVRMLKAGRQAPVAFVINKIRTKEEFAKKIGANFECDSLSMISFLDNTDSLVKYNLDTNIVLSAVIPNTYTFLWNNTPSKIFKKLFGEQQKFWTPKRKQEAASFHLTIQQVFILASIVEEETNKQDDKGKIASVYYNRMMAGMKLAADPTIKFAMRDFALKRIYNKYLSYSSPYNTYLHEGLPPGPICTPSIKTIDAVLNMPLTNYLYFVAKADFSGYSNFANTYTEHMVNAKNYQQALDSIIKLKQQNQPL